MYPAIIIGCILLGTVYVLMQPRDPKLNSPPLVRYKIPIIGHTYSYLFNCEEFLKECQKEYGNTFSIYVWGQIVTIIGKEHIQEVFARDDVFSFNAFVSRKLPGDAMLTNTGGFGNSKYNAKVVKEYITNKLGLYTECMQKSLHLATQKYIGNCEEPKVFKNLYNLSTKIIATSIASIFIGEEEAEHEDIISTFAKLTSDLAVFIIIPPILDFFRPGLQDYINRVIVRAGIYNPANKHRDTLAKHIKNQVEKRLRDKQKYGDSWERPIDLLQDFMDEETFNPKDINYAVLAEKMTVFIFASIHTTSRSGANAIMDLASRPEYMQELYEEQLEIHKKADKNGILPFEAVDEMRKLDNFIRESLRLTGDISTIPHVALKDHTFPNGLQLPKGRVIELYFDDIVYDESLQGPNPKSFDPYRQVNTSSSASKIGRNVLIFGGGKHACPGRIFAVNEIKFLMHHLILKYNFRTESGKIERKLQLGPITFPSIKGIIIEKRLK